MNPVKAAAGQPSARLLPAMPLDRRALVAIDLGAESCRVTLLRWQEDRVQIHLVHRFANQALERDSGLHWDLSYILDGLKAGLRKCAKFASEGIRSIAVDGWAVDYVRLDAEGNALGDPYCYRDERTIAAEAALHRRISAERMREITGIQLFRINTVYQMYADQMASTRAEAMESRRWLTLPEYVLFWLGGRPVAEYTNATHMQMVGLDGAWSGEILSALGQRPESVPPIVLPGTDIGQLRGELAALPAFATTRLIAPACHDTASAIAAIPDEGDNWAYISSGTWSLVGTLLHEPVNSAAARAENFTNLGGADGMVCFQKNVNGMWLLRQCIETWTAEGPTLPLPKLIDAAEAIEARDYTLEVDDPDLLLHGNMPERINAQLRRRGLPELNVEADCAPAMASFIFYSLAARYAAVLAKVAEVTGKRIQRLYIMGGGSQNEFLNRLTAATTGLEVRKAGTECSTLGNFAVQLATLQQTEGPRPACRWAAVLADKSNPGL